MAKRFTFRLDSLHRFRRHRTHQAKLALGEITQLRYAKEQEIEERVLFLEQYRMDVRTVKVADYQMRAEHVHAVRAEIKKLRSELENLCEIESLRRQVLTELMKEEKVLDSLREKKEADHKGLVLSEEQKLMDEIASRRDPSAHAR